MHDAADPTLTSREVPGERSGDAPGTGSATPDATVDARPDASDRAPATRRPRRWHWPRWFPPPKATLVVVIVVAFALLLYRIRGDLDTAIHRVSVAGLVWLPAAFVAESLSFLAYSGVQQRLLRAGGARLSYFTIVRLTIAATGITNLVPGGAAPSSGWLVSQYRRHGVPLSLALWAVLAGGFAAGISVLFLCLVGVGIAGLLTPGAFVGLLVLLAAAAAAGVVVLHHIEVVRLWLDRDRRLPGLGLLRRAVRHAGDVAQFRASLGGGVTVYGLSVANWVLDVSVLATGFLIVHLPVPWTALLFAYAASQIAGSLAPVPGGIGFMEGGMIGALALAGTPAGDAVIATVIYRLITTLGIAGIGGLALFVVHRVEPSQAELSGRAKRLAERGTGAGGPGGPGAGEPPA
jgi:uncharacterized membrane protein YbhN (UPF0104 family)